MDNKKKIALVTGASRGIGLAITKSLVDLGFCVLGICRQEVPDFLKSLLESSGGRGFSVDLSQVEKINAWFSILPEHWKNIDVLVNNAGICRDNLVMRMSDQEWKQVIDTDLNGIFYLTRCFLRGMLKKRWGRIINLSSVVAVSGNLGQANYVAAKAGLIGFSKSLALEVASRNITVNCIAPGFIESDMTTSLTTEQKEMILQRIPMKRAGKPEDIAKLVEYLVSEASNYMTGTVLHINGGLATF